MKPLVFASPWDALLRQRPAAAQSPSAAQSAAEHAEPGTRLASLLQILSKAESLPTLSLAVQADLTPRQVWGLLKAPRARGQVHFEDGRWRFNPQFPGAAVQRAVDLLQGLGWELYPPGEH